MFALAAVGLLGAIGTTGVMASAGGMFGGSSDDSTAAAQSIDIQTPDSVVAESGDTPDGETEDVGDDPAGDVSDDQPVTDVQGDDSPDADETDADEQEVVGGVIDCPTGEDTHFKFESEGNEFEVTGTLVSFAGADIVVLGPDGEVTATADANLEIEGDPQPGDPVKVEGAVLEDGSLVAREIEPACEDEADDADDVDEGEVDDVDDGDVDGQDDAEDESHDDSGHDDDGDDDHSGQGGQDSEDDD